MIIGPSLVEVVKMGGGAEFSSVKRLAAGYWVGAKMIYVLDLCKETPIIAVARDSAAAYWARQHGAAFDTHTAAEAALARLQR